MRVSGPDCVIEGCPETLTQRPFCTGWEFPRGADFLLFKDQLAEGGRPGGILTMFGCPRMCYFPRCLFA